MLLKTKSVKIFFSSCVSKIKDLQDREKGWCWNVIFNLESFLLYNKKITVILHSLYIHCLINIHILYKQGYSNIFLFIPPQKQRKPLYSAASPSGDGSYCISWKMRRKTRRLKVTESGPNIDMWLSVNAHPAPQLFVLLHELAALLL